MRGVHAHSPGGSLPSPGSPPGRQVGSSDGPLLPPGGRSGVLGQHTRPGLTCPAHLLVQPLPSCLPDPQAACSQGSLPDALPTAVSAFRACFPVFPHHTARSTFFTRLSHSPCCLYFPCPPLSRPAP